MASDVLGLDRQTLKDLEVFASESGGPCLFDFCNGTRTEGGARALRRRMERPWSSAERIRATQAALARVAAERGAFDFLPAGHTAARVEAYCHESLPIATAQRLPGFAVAALALWVSHDRSYIRIVNGVQFTCRLIRSLRRLVAAAGSAPGGGELTPLLEEMRALLARPGLAGVPESGAGRWAGAVLRLHRAFRLHERTAIVRLLELAHECDALVAMADVTREQGFTMPEIDAGPFAVRAEGLAHPQLRHAVENAVELDQQRRLLFLTGPNMAGKTTYLRAVATAVYFAQLGMGVRARHFRFVPAERLFTSFSLADDLHRGVSYFRAEALRVKSIAQAVVDGHRVIALLDEPFKGTNVKDAFDASLAMLERFARSEGCLFVFCSHLIELSERLSDAEDVDYGYFEADESGGRLSFDYRLRHGVSGQRLGMRVLREEGIFRLFDEGRAGR